MEYGGASIQHPRFHHYLVIHSLLILISHLSLLPSSSLCLCAKIPIQIFHVSPAVGWGVQRSFDDDGWNGFAADHDCERRTGFCERCFNKGVGSKLLDTRAEHPRNYVPDLAAALVMHFVALARYPPADFQTDEFAWHSRCGNFFKRNLADELLVKVASPSEA